jgi:hypothetical protein
MPKYDVFHGSTDPESIYRQGFVFAYSETALEQHGPGFYFTTSLKTASRYAQGMEVIKAQVILDKPIQTDSGSESNAFHIFPALTAYQAKQMINLAIKVSGVQILDDWGDVEFEGKNAVVSRAVQNYIGIPAAYLMYDLFKDKDVQQALRYITKATGYDGVVVNFGDEQWIVAWYSEQIVIEHR